MNFPVAQFRRINTPFYYNDMQLLRLTARAAMTAAAVNPSFRLEYAVKANNDPEILGLLAKMGFGADCVSAGEIADAKKAGIAPAKISFAGVGKTDREIRYALQVGIGCFNVESIPELEVIAGIAADLGVVAPVALRVNPDIDAHTHHYITTGLAENKFGINMPMLGRALDEVAAFTSVRLIGLHFHIGSQVTITEPFALLCHRVNALVADLGARGIALEHVNMGGGLGVDYDDPDANPIPDFAAYFNTFDRELHLPAGMKVRFEPGRSIVAQCGSLITRVLYVKEGEKKKFVIVDAGMTDLIRPALYGAHHLIQNLTAPADAPEQTYDVVGPVCESSDVFAEEERLPLTRRGDILAIRSAGAYGRSMASTYNSRPLPPNVRF